MHVVISRVRRNEHSPLTRAKTLSYLENILARKEARAAGGDESVLLNTAGNVASASAANLFLVFEDVLVTPDLSSGALPGTTRALILEELAQAAGLGATERPVEPEDLDKASEIFLTSALLGVMPVTVVDGRPVGTGRPGPTAARLHLALMSSWSGSVPRR
jgi:branched-subunit amino acid aminotransferase/4-amino-4-deoxychorismate lyase